LTAPTYGASYGEGKVQGVVKATQTGILWSQVQVLVGPPIVKKPLIFEVSGFFHGSVVTQLENIANCDFWSITFIEVQ